jgi:hypothetical protein
MHQDEKTERAWGIQDIHKTVSVYANKWECRIAVLKLAGTLDQSDPGEIRTRNLSLEVDAGTPT